MRKLINYITGLNMKATGLFTIQIYSLSIQQLSTGLLTFLHALALKRVWVLVSKNLFACLHELDSSFLLLRDRVRVCI